MTIDRTNIILSGIIILGFILRIVGIGYGLPNLYHRDEQYYINLALSFGMGDLNPHIFENPPFASYLLFFLYGIYYLYLKVFGIITNPSGFLELYLTDPSSFMLIGRAFLGLVLGTVSLPVIYWLGKKLFSRSIGLLSAFFLALSTLHVRDSHYACNNILLMLIIMLFYLFIVQLIETPNKRFLTGSAICLGLAIGTKYNAGLLLIPALLAFVPIYGPDWNLKIRKMVLFFSIVLVAYFFANPFSIINLKEFIHSFATQVADEYPVGLFHHLKYSLYQGVGLGILLSTGVGILIFFKNSISWPKIIFFSGAVIWYGVNIFFSQKYARYAIPLLPFVYISAAAGLQFIMNLKIKSLKVVFLSVFILLFVFQTYKTIKVDTLSRQMDNRDVAQKWIEQNLPEGAVVAVSDWGPQLVQSEKQIQEKIKAIEDLQVINKRKQKRQIDLYKNKKLRVLLTKAQASLKTFQLYLLYDKKTKPMLSKPETLLYDWDEIRRHNVEYLVLDLSFPEEAGRDFWLEIKNKTRLVRIISPYGNGRAFGRYDPFENTGGSLENQEVIHRLRYGEIIGVYKVAVH